MKVKVTFTVEVDPVLWAEYHGIDVEDVRDDVKDLFGDPTSTAPHLFDAGVIR